MNKHIGNNKKTKHANWVILFCIWYQKSSTPPSDEWSERCFWIGALAISFLYSSGFTSSHIHLLLTGTLSCLHHNSSSKLLPILDRKLQTSHADCKTLLQKTSIELRTSIAKLCCEMQQVQVQGEVKVKMGYEMSGLFKSLLGAKLCMQPTQALCVEVLL